MYDLIIIGAGPAGLAAGLYAGRYRLDTLIIEKTAVGGQIVLSHTIENYPGFPGGVHTHELMDNMRKQVEDLGINIDIHEITKLEIDSDVKKVYAIDKTFEAKSLIIATGCQPKRLGVLGEERLIGRGVSYCGTCDGPFFKAKEIAVVGGGDRALEEALFLTRYASKVNLIHRKPSLRGSKILEEEAAKSGKINFILNSTLEEIEGKEKVSGVKIKNIADNSLSHLACQGVFVFIGIEPSTNFLKKSLNLDDHGFIITDQNLQTTQRGVFAAGDCRQKNFRQVVTACSDGAIAASQVKNFLKPY